MDFIFRKLILCLVKLTLISIIDSVLLFVFTLFLYKFLMTGSHTGLGIFSSLYFLCTVRILKMSFHFEGWLKIDNFKRHSLRLKVLICTCISNTLYLRRCSYINIQRSEIRIRKRQNILYANIQTENVFFSLSCSAFRALFGKLTFM